MLPCSFARAVRTCLAAVLLAFATGTLAADFATRGGPEPANIDPIVDVLRSDPYDLELLISFGTSKGGSAGHLALAIRDAVPGDDLVYSANFYADRSPEHATGFYTADLMVAIPKKEYLFRTTSSLGETASFGLDFGEIYKRSVVGVRVYGVPAAEKDALAAFFGRINDDYHKRASKTEYHDGEITYDYLRLNCAKTIGSAFRYGAGYRDLEITSALLSGRKVFAAANANVPTEMAMKLVKEWDARGYRLDVVLYRKYPASPYVDPHEEAKVAFKDLPNRFPSVRSRDFTEDERDYQDFDNLYAMYLLYDLARYRVQVNVDTKLLEIAGRKPASYADAARIAREHAKEDSAGFLRRGPFRAKGARIGDIANDAAFEAVAEPAR